MDSMKMECPVCGSSEGRELSSQPEDFEYHVSAGNKYKIRACSSCGSGFLWPRPTVDDLVRFYPDDYHAYNDDHGRIAGMLVTRRNRSRMQLYLSLTQERPVALFDVGSGDCRHFDALRSTGDFTFAGVEINPGMVEKANKAGYNVVQGTLEDLDVSLLKGRFDIVTMYQLVEHVLDPRMLFRKARILLKPGGVIIGQLPCLGSIEASVFGRYWAGYHYPRHLQQFTKRSLLQLIENEKFGNIRVTSALHLQAALSLQNWLTSILPPKKPLVFGKTPYYSWLLLCAAPFCIFEHALGAGGMMDFIARREA